MKILGVIPVRMQSTRLPGKPLCKIGTQTLVERVWRQAKESKEVHRLVITTDSEEIRKVAEGFGAEVIMTGEVVTGSDRVAEAYKALVSQGQDFECVLNIQGDMPFIKPSIIDSLASTFKVNLKNFGMGTIATPILDEEEFNKPSSVKVVLGGESKALYFSRSPIPYPRIRDDISPQHPLGFKHIGLYIFHPEVLMQMHTLPQATCERREGLEQLRLLAAGIPILVVKIPRDHMEPSIEVDTPEDLQRANALVRIA